MSSIEEQIKNAQDELKEAKRELQELKDDSSNNYKLDITNQNVYHLNFLLLQKQRPKTTIFGRNVLSNCKTKRTTSKP